MANMAKELYYPFVAVLSGALLVILCGLTAFIIRKRRRDAVRISGATLDLEGEPMLNGPDHGPPNEANQVATDGGTQPVQPLDDPPGNEAELVTSASLPSSLRFRYTVMRVDGHAC